MTWQDTKNHVTSNHMTWRAMTWHHITSHDMTRRLATNQSIFPHVTSHPITLVHLTSQPTTWHHIPHHSTLHHHHRHTTETQPATTKTPPPDGTAGGWCTQKSRFGHCSGWPPCAQSIYRQILSLASIYMYIYIYIVNIYPVKLPPRLARELLVRIPVVNLCIPVQWDGTKSVFWSMALIEKTDDLIPQKPPQKNCPQHADYHRGWKNMTWAHISFCWWGAGPVALFPLSYHPCNQKKSTVFGQVQGG